MNYPVTVRYNNKTVNFKVSKSQLSGTFKLHDFLKHVRCIYQHEIETVHMLLDWPTEECLQMENNEIPITQEYLKEFAIQYHLPKKLAKIGIEPNKERQLELGARLYQLRNKNLKTQLEVAYAIDVARTTYAGYETGQNEPDIKTLIKLADLYGVSLDYLVGRY